MYGIFPSKADLFWHVLDVATVGDEEPVAVASRPEIQSAFCQSDPRDAINQTINYTVALFERAGDLIMVTVQAADADMRAAANAAPVPPTGSGSISPEPCTTPAHCAQA